MESILDILQDRATYQNEWIVYSFSPDGETERDHLTYGALDTDARAIAARLQRVAKPGDRALLLYPPGLDFMRAFFGCLYANIIAVPAYAPHRHRHDERLTGIMHDAEPSVVLTTVDLKQKGLSPYGLSDTTLCTDDIPADTYKDFKGDPCREGIAFLQYTSGSTAHPRGVMVSHRNIMSNAQCLLEAADYTADTIAVTWLPHFHDMGLVEGLLQPVIHGFCTHLIPAVAFLQRPLRWLWAISKYRANHSGGPNFAYDLCVKALKGATAQGLDLSCWKLAYNGAEPIRKQTMERFVETFRGYGFRRSSFYPAYGLAEATLQVAGSVKGQGPRVAKLNASDLEQHNVRLATDTTTHCQTIVSVGGVLGDTRAIIVDPNSLTRCDDAHVGEIWLSGGSIAEGYWKQESETRAVFRAFTADSNDGPYLRTGDLGFLKEGELYITGRLKDTIVIYGKNHYPQDIEETVRSIDPEIIETCAAFSVSLGGEERVVIFVEVSRQQVREIENDKVSPSVSHMLKRSLLNGQ